MAARRLFDILLSILILFLETNSIYAEPSNVNTHRLNMGFYGPSINFANRTDIEISLSFWAQEIAAQQKVITSAPVRIFEDLDEMQKSFAQGELDLIVAPPLEIARRFKRSDLADGFMAVNADRKPNALIVLVRAASQIASIKDLPGKRLLLLQGDALAEVFLETLTLKQLNKHYQKVFSDIQRQDQNNHMILDLFFGKADVAIVYESAYQLMLELNPQIGTQLKVLSSFPVFSRNFSYFHRDYPYSKELSAIATNRHTPRLEQILAVFQLQAIEHCTVSELEPIDNLYQEYLKLSKKAPIHE